MKTHYIAIDFDGTIVQHDYPRIGKPVVGAKETIQALNDCGHMCFLWTMRDGQELHDAMMFLCENGYQIVAYNQSPGQFNGSTKQYAHIYIDDAALGAPLILDPDGCVVVDWATVARRLNYLNLISDKQLDTILTAITYGRANQSSGDTAE